MTQSHFFRTLLFFAGWTVVQAASATTYYVDAVSGSDPNAGVAPGEAWATVGQVNSQSLAPGGCP